MRAITSLVLALAAGAALSEDPYSSPGVVAPALSEVDVSAYNAEIQKQGLSHYCPNGICDTLPALLVAYAPAYPEIALQEGLSGEATIIFSVDESGTPTAFEIESSSAPEFAEAAIDALKHWRFRPSTLNGKPIRVSSRQQFPFVAR